MDYKLVAALLTLMVLSYALGDNVFFRIATQIFLGVAVGYAVLMALYEVILPQAALFSEPLNDQLADKILAGLALAMTVIMVMRFYAARNGMIVSLSGLIFAFMLAVGGALVVGGALRGTLWPQIAMAAPLGSSGQVAGPVESVVNTLVFILGTLGALIFFRYRPGLNEGVSIGQSVGNFFAGAGRWIVLITLAALFANGMLSYLSALSERLHFLVTLF
jgi:hypothetical protein